MCVSLFFNHFYNKKKEFGISITTFLYKRLSQEKNFNIYIRDFNIVILIFITIRILISLIYIDQLIMTLEI